MISLVLLVGMTGCREYAQYKKKSTVEEFLSMAGKRHNIGRDTVPDPKGPSTPRKNILDAYIERALKRARELRKKSKIRVNNKS